MGRRPGHGWWESLRRERWVEIGRILITGVLVFLYWRAIVRLPVLIGAVAFGLYPLAKTGLNKESLMPGPIYRFLADHHTRLDSLLQQAIAHWFR
ncbi:MAG: hypothetical protein HYZ72_14540 [Deltaproteobacteria bacterium]|nr:hypothetical protein [Deltaproteobacteria bacterium]